MTFNEFKEAFHAESVEHILNTFPTRYDSLNVSDFCLNPKNGQRLVYKGSASKIKKINNGNSLIRFILSTSNRNIPCLLINQPFYLNKINKPIEFLFVLYYSEARHVYVVHSIHDLDSLAAISGIKPVYSLPSGVTNSYFNNFLKKELCSPFSKSVSFKHIIPSKYVKKYNLLDKYTALKYIHFPETANELRQGLRVFKYEEALLYCTNALIIKNEASKVKRHMTHIDHNKINQFVANLPYKLTKDQLVAVKEIIVDLEKDHVMYRLLQGDVGTGKTIVSFLACYGNYLRGKQTIYLAPTYELTKQHYENAKNVFNNTTIKLAFLSSNTSSKERKNIIADLRSNNIDILFSTHAALSSDLVYSNLGLIIIDEQQLFGVQQREQLLKRNQGADMLMMSATPIPRTLSQIVNADMDVSLLQTFPRGSRNVKTVLVRSTDPLIDSAIKKALAVKRQVFIVAPKIEEGTKKSASVNAVYEDIVSRYGQDNCQLLHGKMKKEQQDEIYQLFLSGEKPVLVSTTVIEVGIDVSKACLLIVYDANYFGLSTLHQLRGRIGRSGAFALALLVYDGDDENSLSKLKFLAENTDGLKVAEFDMEQRGCGSYGGVNQSGKSELQVCNFVKDSNIFKCAKQDAMEILSQKNEEENKFFLEELKRRKRASIV